MSDRYNDKSKVPGGRYYVEFNNKDPDICKILQDRPVPDSIKNAPDRGWEEIPGKRYYLGEVSNVLSDGRATIFFYHEHLQRFLISKETFFIMSDMGKRYFISYYPDDPSFALKVYNIPVPDSIRYAPPEGWQEIPK